MKSAYIKLFFFVIFAAVLFAFFINARTDKVRIAEYWSYDENGTTKYVFSFLRDEGGKNIAVFPADLGISAKELLMDMKEIDAITSLEDNLGYVKAFGGIGKNFLIVANKSYEISVTKSVNYTFYVR